MPDRFDVYVTLPETASTVLAGALNWEAEGTGQSIGTFKYDSHYLAKSGAYALDPFDLPLNTAPHPKRSESGLFGVLRDAGPDQWGRAVLHDRFGVTSLREIDYLVDAPQDGVGNIRVMRTGAPYAEAGNRKIQDLDRLAAAIERIDAAMDEGKPVAGTDRELAQAIDPSTAMGGARPKITIQDDHGIWLAKFPSRNDKENNPRIEYATLLLARDAGIDVPAAKIAKVAGRDVLLVRRFDRFFDEERNIHRYGFASAMTVLRADNTLTDRHRWSYLLFADELRRWGQENLERDYRQLFTRIVFNALVSNLDDHPRNHGLLRDGRGWKLSPAYDLVPTHAVSVERRDLALVAGRDGRAATRRNLLSACDQFGLSTESANSLIDAMQEVVRQWDSVYEMAGVSAGDRRKIAAAFDYPGFEYAEAVKPPLFLRH